MAKERISTSKLLSKIFRTSNISRFVKSYDDDMEYVPFCEYISNLCAQKGTVPAQVIQKSGIERTYGHQLFNGNSKPSRDKVIQLAFGFEMTYDEAQELLKAARKSALYPRIKRDAVIIYALNKKHAISNVQVTLDDMGLRILGKDDSRGG